MNRMVRPVMFAFEADVVHQFSEISFGAVGAPTINTAKSKGICNVTRVSAGKYTITFGAQFSPARFDTYTKLLGISCTFNTQGNAGAAPAAPVVYVTNNSITASGSASITIQCESTAGAATDPASGELIYLAVQLCRSSAI